MIKLIKIRVGKATASDLSHPVIFGSSNREGITLPDSQPLLKKLNQWQDAYSKLNLSKRKLKANNDVTTNISKTDLSNFSKQCKYDANEVLKDFNVWLESNTFIKEMSEQQIDPSDRVQILLQIEDKELERLPWHLADIFKRFSSTEVALYQPPGANRPSVSDLSDNNSKNTTVKILAVFGDDSGIDTRNDLEKLKHRFPDLVSLGGDSQEKLTKQTLFEKLDEEQWDILFFAGHSSTSTENQTGKIYLHKECEGLEFEDISNAIDTAVKKGLKIAIFNSCDGLGLGHSLSELGVPQIILMREPVPDIVAQTFLGIFLKLYAQGSSFYQSVSDARKKLQKLDDFPCAEWLPTIYQSSTDYPPSWADLQVTTNKEPPIDIHWSFKIITLAIIILSLFPRTQVFAVGIEQSIQSLVRMTILRDKSPTEQSGSVPVNQLRYPEKSKLVIIHIDNDSLKDIEVKNRKTQRGKFESNPIDKEYLATIVERLAKAGVKSIAVDYILDEPSKNESDRFLNMVIQEAINKYKVKFLFASEEKDGKQVSITSNPTIESRQSIATGDIGFVFPISIFPSIQPNLIQYIQPWSHGGDEQVLFSYFLAMMQEQPQNQTMENWIENTIQNSQIIPVANSIPFFTSLTIDYSRSPDSIYSQISAKQFLKTPKFPELDNPSDKVVLIAPGGYPEASTNKAQAGGDNYDTPLSISLKHPKRYFEEYRPFPGGNIHAYIANGLLTKDKFITKSVLIRVSDLLMVLIAMISSHYIVKYCTRKNIVVVLACASIVYIIFCLTIYSIANIMVPFLLPCATTALAYILPIRRIKYRF